MKKEIADLWVNALRSGKYKQGQGCLRFDDKFCCIGVLCEISGFEYEWGAGFPDSDDQIVQWAGLRDPQGKIPIQFQNSTLLTSINDFGVPFSQIADLIEKHWEEL